MHTHHVPSRFAPTRAGAFARAVAAAALLAAALVSGAHAAPVTRTVPRQGHSPAATVTNLPQPQPFATARPAAPAAVRSGPWEKLGPNFFTDKVNCVASRILSQPTLDIGSDGGGGYWEGYAGFDAGWTETGLGLDVGIEQMVMQLVFPDTGGYFERRTFSGTDGILRYTDDNGTTSAPVTLTCYNWETVVPGKTRLTISDLWSNVEYLVARTAGPADTDSGSVFMVSFDSGASFQEFNYFGSSTAADMWSSQNNDGVLRVAYFDVGEQMVNVLTFDQHTLSWGDPLTPFSPTSDNLPLADLQMTGQSFGDDAARLWISFGDSLYRTTDGGDTWYGVRGNFDPAGPRALTASIGTPDLVLWTDLYSPPYFAALHQSSDGGVTDRTYDYSWPWNPSKVDGLPTNIDAVRWNWAFALTAHERLASGATRTHAVQRTIAPEAAKQALDTTERLYVSSSGGTYMIVPGDTTGTTITYSGLGNAEVNDLFTLRGQGPYDVVAGSATHGELVAYSASPGPLECYTAISSGIGNYVSDLASSLGPNQASPVTWSLFPDGLLVVSGGGYFTAAFANGYESSPEHRWVTQDTQHPLSCFTGSNQLRRVQVDPIPDTLIVTPLPGLLGGLHNGIVGFGMSASNPNQWYAAMGDGSLFHSSNGGATWTASTGTAPNVMDAYHLDRVKFVVHPTNPLEAWCIGSTVLHTLNGGTSWQVATAGLPTGNTLAFGAAYDSIQFNRVYLAAASGAYFWNGVQWTGIADPAMPKVQFRAVESVPALGVMRFATWGAGIWDYTTGGRTGVEPAAVTALALAPRENPVRGSGRLDFALPRDGRVRLEVMDVAGRRVATLAEGEFTAGRHTATLDAGTLAAGVYFARLATEHGGATTRIVVLH